MSVYYIADRQTSFAVSASTEALKVKTVAEGETEWSIVGLKACLRKRGDLPDQKNRKKLGCEEEFFVGYEFENEVTLRWPDDYNLDIRIAESGDLEVLVLFSESAEAVRLTDDHPLPNGSQLFIPADLTRPILPLRGFLTIGQNPVRADQLILTKGRFEIREKLIGNESSRPVVDGEFFPGDRVEFVCKRATSPLRSDLNRCTDSEQVLARAFVTDQNVTDRTFEVVATTSPLHQSCLQLTRVGGQPSCVNVGWTNRIMSDARPVAIATILGLIATIIALSNAYLAMPSVRSDQKNRR